MIEPPGLGLDVLLPGGHVWLKPTVSPSVLTHLELYVKQQLLNKNLKERFGNAVNRIHLTAHA